MHPLISKELNDEQQSAVLQMKNCVVAAGAGSGKTRVLAYRYAHLIIEHGFSVDSILTLTFTKKATAEMYERIYDTIKTIACSDLSTTIQKERCLAAIDSFHSARIQTIDSFCSGIVRNASRQYGIRPDFTIDNEGVKEYCKKRALDYMLKHRNLRAMQELIGNEKFENIIESLFVNPMNYTTIAESIDFIHCVDSQTEVILTEWKKQIQNIFTHRLEFEDANVETIDMFIEIEQNLIDDITVKEYLRFLRDTSKTSEDKYSFIETIKESLLLFLKPVRVLATQHKGKKENKEIKNEIDLMKKIYSTLTALSQYILFFSQSLDIFPILQSYHNEITEWKRTTGTLSYADVSSLALQILLENPNIRKSEKEKVSAIMIDEFQDNNAMQKDMLFLLAEKIDRDKKTVPLAQELCSEKLFFVGDEKQSIYKFRGADVSVFRELKNDLSETLTLSTNYRSHAQLISGFNTIFGTYTYCSAKQDSKELHKNHYVPSVFLQDYQLEQDNEIPLFEAEYTSIFSNNTKDESIDKKRIHICLLDNSKMKSITEDSGDIDEENEIEDLVEAENIAVYTAEKIASLCKLEYEPKDIAILFRSYSTQSMYEKHLRRLGIPYIAENITNFFGDAPVNDLLAFMRLIVYPKDTQSFLTILRSPFISLSNQDALACILHIDDKDVVFLEEHANMLAQESKNRYMTTLMYYTDLREKAHSFTCAEMVQELWYANGYRYETLWNNDVSLFSEYYDYLFDIARNFDLEGKNLTSFVDYLFELDTNSERLDDMNIPLERAGAVQLMSIHKSKGLEFPVVFLVGVSTKGKGAKNTDKVYIDKAYGPSLNFPLTPNIENCQKNYFFNEAKILEKQMEEAELRRLLYVAMTRAESELYITGSYAISKKNSESLLKKGVDPSDVSEANLFSMLKALFELQVKDKNSKENNSQVAFEYCIQNNTLFAFLLPIIAFYDENTAPFTLESIEKKTREALLKVQSSENKESLEEAQARVSPVYERAAVLTTPILESPYRSPSHLSHSMEIDKTLTDNDDKGEHEIKELDNIVNAHKGSFDYSHFGTLCHAYAESLFTKNLPKIHSDISNELNEKELTTVCEIAKKMAHDFSQSPLGTEAITSKWQKVEHDFKLILKNKVGNTIIIKGQIDLLYERSDGSLVIVDYKTDSVETPTTHLAQLAAYRKAVSKIYNKNISDISCFLYYLRTGNAIEVSSELHAIDLESMVFN